MAGHRPMGTFCWCELGTSDPQRAKAFYQKLFGWSFADEKGEMGTYTKVKLGAEELGGMYELAGPMFEGVPPHWMFYVAVEDADETAERAADLGGKAVMPPMDIPGAGRMAVLEDATGAKFSVWQPGAHRGTKIPPMTPNAFGWVELQTDDAEAAKAFYTRLFGWDAKSDKGDTPYTEWLLAGAPPFGGMIEMDERWGGAPPCWLGYVMVEDCDATFAKAQKLGASTLVAPRDIEKVGRFAVIADPQGAAFAFIKLSPTHC